MTHSGSTGLPLRTVPLAAPDAVPVDELAWRRKCRWALRNRFCFDGTACGEQVRCHVRRQYYERALYGARTLRVHD